MSSTSTLTPYALTTPLPELTLTPVMTNVTLTLEEQAKVKDYMATIQSVKESYMWVILALGFPGNLLSLVVICRMRSLGSPALYISTLAVVDNLAIVIKVLILQFIHHQVLIGPTGCKLMFFLGNHLVVYANWVLIAMAIERFFAVWQPLRVARTWTSRRAAIGLAVLLLVTFTLASPLFVIVTVKNIGTKQICTVDPQYRNVSRVWQWVQVAAYGFLPCTLLFTLNVSIIVLIGRARRLRLSLTSSSSSSCTTSPSPKSPAPFSSSSSSPARSLKRSQASKNSPNTLNTTNTTNTTQQDPSACSAHRESFTTTTPCKRRSRAVNRQASSSSKKSPPSLNQGVQRQATILLLVTSAVLVVTTTPVCVYLLVQQWWLPQPGSVEYARKRLCSLVLRVICDANHAVNFYLYFVSARRFRAYLCKALCWFCLRDRPGRRNSDGITRHLSFSRSTLKGGRSSAHLLSSPRKEERDNGVPLTVFGGGGGGGRGGDVHCNGGVHDSPLL